MRISLLLTGFAALALGACATALPVGMFQLGASPILSGGSYTSGGGITVAADLREKDGMTMVCGVWAQSQRQSVLTKHVERQVLSSGAIYLDGTRVIQDLGFMNEVEPAADYSGLNANCVMAERPWQPGDAGKTAKIRIPRQVVYNDADGDPDGGGGFTVYFRQTGPGAEKNGFSLSEYLKDKISN